MEHQKIDPASRVWIVYRGPDGRLRDEMDPALLETLNPAHSAEEIADALVQAAGEMDVAETRLW